MVRGSGVSAEIDFRRLPVFGIVPDSLTWPVIWLPAVLLGGVPVVGPLFTGTAAVTTWVMATAGFGATLLSRAGVRGTFVRKLDLALTDEQYWTDDDMPTPYRSRTASQR